MVMSMRATDTLPVNKLELPSRAPIIHHIADLASRASLKDPSYSLGLQKFHIFCNLFSVLEMDWLPVGLEFVHSFALWAAAEPNPEDPAFANAPII